MENWFQWLHFIKKISSAAHIQRGWSAENVGERDAESFFSLEEIVENCGKSTDGNEQAKWEIVKKLENWAGKFEPSDWLINALSFDDRK